MGKANFTEDLERDAIPSDRRGGYPVMEVALWPGISKYSLYE